MHCVWSLPTYTAQHVNLQKLFQNSLLGSRGVITASDSLNHSSAVKVPLSPNQNMATGCYARADEFHLFNKFPKVSTIKAEHSYFFRDMFSLGLHTYSEEEILITVNSCAFRRNNQQGVMNLRSMNPPKHIYLHCVYPRIISYCLQLRTLLPVSLKEYIKSKNIILK